MFTYRKLSKTPTLNTDFTVNTKQSLSELYGIKYFDSEDQAWNNEPELVVISLPSSMHFDACIKGAHRGVDLFVEKPGIVNISQFNPLSQAVIQNKVGFFVSFQRRFHPLTLRIKQLLDSNALGRILNVNIQVHSFLPSWHPYESFTDLYACRKDLGGGVIRTECHELDLMNLFFGTPKNHFVVSGNRSSTYMNVEDCADLLIEYTDFAANVSLSFMSKFCKRTITISGEQGILHADYLNSTYTYNNVHSNTPIVTDLKVTNDDMFYAQASHFLNHHRLSDYSYLDSLQSLSQFFPSN